MAINWHAIKDLPWRERNASIEAAMRAWLASQPAGRVFETYEVALELWPSSMPSWYHKEVGKVAQILARMAPHMPPAIATHDGETIIRYGRKWRRWRWHGGKV